MITLLNRIRDFSLRGETTCPENRKISLGHQTQRKIVPIQHIVCGDLTAASDSLVVETDSSHGIPPYCLGFCLRTHMEDKCLMAE